MFRHHPILTVVTFVYLGVVGWITLGPQPFDEGSDSLCGGCSILRPASR